jgi:acetyl-CoA carboxylase biotin carboxylase subunit
MHVKLADESVCIGPPSALGSYLNIPALLSACEITGAEAIHPGYGFLSEDARFARIANEHGLIFIGPSPEHIDIMGNKILAKKTMEKLGVPCVPGSNRSIHSFEEAVKTARDIEYPVLIKAVAGGGGRGMRVVESENELSQALFAAQNESMAAFGVSDVYIEKYLRNPRHIEVQIVADHYGKVLHFGERDCSIQRRHQKILEESPSPALNEEQRQRIGDVCTSAMQEIGYLGVGTIEFLYEEGKFYFIEMNTRLQVEHPVTEAVYDIDLVHKQIEIACHQRLNLQQSSLVRRGHAIQCRINAENPWTFVPSPGKILEYYPPGGLGVRVDSAIYGGYVVPPYYDSLIGKLVVHGSTRDKCMMRLKRALSELVVDGIDTTAPLFIALLAEKEFIDGDYSIHWLEEYIKKSDFSRS